MAGRILPHDHPLNFTADINRTNPPNLQQAQEVIYKFLIDITKKFSSETVLLEFKRLFVSYDSTASMEVIDALYKIIFNNQEDEFRNTLKRSCYILINNWASKRKYSSIQELIQLLVEPATIKSRLSPSLKRLRTWMINFIKSDDYQELKLFASSYAAQEKGPWSQRYISYLLVPQYLDSQNPIEQREVAINLSRHLKERFKFDLALYMARCDSPNFKEDKFSNPTKLGSRVIFLIKKIVSKNLLFGYIDYANLFIQQTKNISYKDFKQSLKKYLFLSINSQKALDFLNEKFSEKLESLYENHHDEDFNNDLLLRTSRKIIELFTTENGQEPSFIFIVLIAQETPLTIVLILLKIILICKHSHAHLEACIAQLIRYYEKYPEEECRWFINFLEIFNIIFAIYTTKAQYNLVKVKNNEPNSHSAIDLDAYRVFSQVKGADLRGANLYQAKLNHADLSAADLRGTNLSGADLSNADLSLAKLSRANLSNATLNNTKFIAADLKSADLRGASLSGAYLRRANLRQAKLSSASLTAIKRDSADIEYAELSKTRLNGSDLRGADLRYCDLQPADLSEANLSGADLRHTLLIHANLSSADLHQANLREANLSGANLSEANLNYANLNQVNLHGADLSGSLLRRATLCQASLRNANLSRTDLSYADLSNCDLSGADLRDALLRHVNLGGANLSDADLRGANLFGTDLSRANVKGTQFSEKLPPVKSKVEVDPKIWIIE
jgi:uncharacterized protein YjbI with pentapeptide repeats